MPSRLCRGQSHYGLGKAPSATREDQYVIASGPFAKDAAAMDSLVHWLSPETGDWSTKETRLCESWSLTTLGGWTAVARILGPFDYVFNTDTGQRRAGGYFASSRLWQPQEVTDQARSDPGNYLGRPDAFDPPWNAPDLTRLDPGPAGASQPITMPQPAALWLDGAGEGTRKLAEMLLGRLHECAGRGFSLVVLVPQEFFAAGPAALKSQGDAAMGTSISRVVGFARASLPLAIRRKVQVRINTPRVSTFLEKGATLIVASDRVDPASIKSATPFTVINKEGKHLAGQAPSSSYRAYAGEVVKRVVDDPRGLFGFVDRISSYLSDAPPTDTQMRVCRSIYYITSCDDAHSLQEVVRETFLRSAKIGGKPWVADVFRLLTPSENEGITSDTHASVLLGAVDDPEQSEGLQALAAESLATLKRRGHPITSAVESTWVGPPSDAQLQCLFNLYQSRLLAAPAFASRTAQVSISRLHTLGMLEPALRSELTTGQILRRDGHVPELANAAHADATVLSVLLDATMQQQLSDAWLVRAVQGASVTQLGPLAEALLPRLPHQAFEQNVTGLLYERLLHSPVRSVTVDEELARLLKPLDPTSQLRRLLELLQAAGPGNKAFARAASRLQGALPQIVRLEDREVLLARVLDPKSVLRPSFLVNASGSLIIPADWYRDLLDLLASPALFDLVSDTEQLAQLLDLSRSSRSATSVVAAALDTQFSSRPDAVVLSLLRQGTWGVWVKATRLDPASVRSAFLAWLTSPYWHDQAVIMDDWLAATEKLGDTLSASDLDRLLDQRERNVRWMWIPPFQARQMIEIASRLTDLGGLLAVANCIHFPEDPDYPVHRLLFDNCRFNQDLSTGAFDWLCRQGIDEGASYPQLEAREVFGLIHHAGAMRRDIIDARSHLPTEWLDGFGDWLARAGNFAQAGKDFLQRLEANLGSRKESYAPQTRPEVAQQARALGLQHIAAYFDAPPPQYQLVERIIEALGDPASESNPCWKDVSRVASGGAESVYPLTAASSILRQTTAAAGPPRGALDAFVRAVKANPLLLDCTFGASNRVPALELAAVLATAPLGEISSRLVLLRAAAGLELPELWWKGLLGSMVEAVRPGDSLEAAVTRVWQLTGLGSSSRNARDRVLDEWVAGHFKALPSRASKIVPFPTVSNR